MLRLSRAKGEAVTVKGRCDEGPGVKVHVLSIAGGRVELGFEAPEGSIVLRSELVFHANEPATPTDLTD